MIDIYGDLGETGLDVWQQGNVPEVLPDSFITIWNDYSVDNLNSDNATNLIEYQFTIIYYTKDWDNIYTNFEDIVSLLKSKKYIASGMGFDIDSGIDEYVARCIEVQRIERRN